MKLVITMVFSTIQLGKEKVLECLLESLCLWFLWMKKNNSIILGDNENLFAEGLIASNCNFIYLSEFETMENIKCKIRYSSKFIDCKIVRIDDEED